MKIEICENTAWTIIALVVGLVIGFIALQIKAYNIVPFEKGYSQRQLNSSLGTMWVKEGGTNDASRN